MSATIIETLSISKSGNYARMAFGVILGVVVMFLWRREIKRRKAALAA